MSLHGPVKTYRLSPEEQEKYNKSNRTRYEKDGDKVRLKKAKALYTPIRSKGNTKST